ncbi:GNAT family N-acetyltransferase [Candidatus Marinarcus aquaticus]|uniref:N-acetyltransferase domain-containing protein n=1 Tax=Candidatus Marinarcus aquaticus TaxID=2044504 RepID=A0A4Q0XNQ7_9BACT|nr:GNAT family N-acetyltransferase [Candidatus Marinarcus aquaticus]RXJ56204.1 hypothetical protein CRV04_09160 [Candidatus Marinarcus aquaticus]
MHIIELTRDEFFESVQSIEDYDSLNFSKHCLDWWDNYFSWTKFPPLCLVDDEEEHVCYLFYNISKDNQYLTIHNLLTPKAHRYKGYAKMLFAYLFEKVADQNIERFKMYCVSSSLSFYNKLGLEYWGINDLGQYYCDYKMPKETIDEIPDIVKNASLFELGDSAILGIYEKLKNNGQELEEKRWDIYEEILEKFQDRFHFDQLCERVESIKS